MVALCGNSDSKEAGVDDKDLFLMDMFFCKFLILIFLILVNLQALTSFAVSVKFMW